MLISDRLAIVDGCLSRVVSCSDVMLCASNDRAQSLVASIDHASN